MNPLSNAGLFLIQVIFDFYIFVFMLRVVLQWVNTDYKNPIFLMIIKLTHAPLKPVRRWIPDLYGIDIAVILILLVLEMMKLILLTWLQSGSIPYLPGLLVLAFSELLSQLINLFFYAVLALVLVSWLSPVAQGPLVEILIRVSEPLIRPVRRLIPSISGVDISPVLVMLSLKLLTILLAQPLIQIGAQLALGPLMS